MTDPAGTWIESLQAPTGTVTFCLKPMAPEIANWKLPVRPDPGTACLQISMYPVTSLLVNSAVVVVDSSPPVIVNWADPPWPRCTDPGTRLLEGRALIAVTVAYGTFCSFTVAVPTGTWNGEVHVPVVTVCVELYDPSLTWKVNGPLTGAVWSE